MGIRKTIAMNAFLLKAMFKTSLFRIICSVVLLIFEVACQFVSSVLYVKYLLDAITTGGRFMNVVYFSICLMAATLLLSFFRTIFVNKVIPLANLRVQKYAQTIIFEKLKSLDISCYDDPQFYNDSVLAVNEFDSRIMSAWSSIESLLRSILTAISMLGFIVVFEPVVIVFSVVPIAVSTVFSLLSNKMSLSFTMDSMPIVRESAYVRRVFFMQQYAKELRSTKVAETMIKKFYSVLQQWNGLINKYVFRRTVYEFIPTLADSIFGSVGMGIFLCYKIMVKASFSVGGFTGLMTAVTNFSVSLSGVFTAIPNFNDNALYAKKVLDLLQYVNKVVSGDEPVPDSKNYSIELIDVSFRYTDNDEYILSNVNMKINAGEKVALVGENGAGKTTLVKLLLRLYDPTNGHILLNGQDIRGYDITDYRQKFSTVFQDFQVYATTVAENVMMAPFTQKDKDTIDMSLAESRLEIGDVTKTLTREFDADGIVLSGGQSQKLALARVFAREHSPIILLDEPSSALDPISEYYIIKQINEKFSEKTILFISHRLTTTRDVNKIYLLSNGRIIEEGSHSQLMRKDGVYADLFNKQAEKFRLD
jgi:ATP-binding cassette subfamily B protein